jgi:hypothetical protein
MITAQHGQFDMETKFHAGIHVASVLSYLIIAHNCFYKRDGMTNHKLKIHKSNLHNLVPGSHAV